MPESGRPADEGLGGQVVDGVPVEVDELALRARASSETSPCTHAHSPVATAKESPARSSRRTWPARSPAGAAGGCRGRPLPPAPTVGSPARHGRTSASSTSGSRRRTGGTGACTAAGPRGSSVWEIPPRDRWDAAYAPASAMATRSPRRSGGRSWEPRASVDSQIGPSTRVGWMSVGVAASAIDRPERGERHDRVARPIQGRPG